MKTYILQIDPITIRSCGWVEALAAARYEIATNPELIAKIYVARAGEKESRIVAEISREGYRLINQGRCQRTRSLLKVSNDG